MVAVTHDGPEIPDVDAAGAQIPVPAGGVQWIEGKSRRGDLPAALDAYLPFLLGLLCAKGVIDGRHVEHCRVEQGMRPEQSLLGQQIGGVGRLDQQQRSAGRTFQPPQGATRQHEVIARGELQVSEVAVQLTLSAMHEQQLIAIGVPHQVIHAGGELPVAQLAVGV